MTYFSLLAIFIVPVVGLLAFWAARQRLSRLEVGALLVHVALALLYTTPWDNYLVATGVWWYDPRLVTGVRLGWVPIEEYTFFVLQTLLTGLWYLFVRRRLSQEVDVRLSTSTRVRISAVLTVGLFWAASLVLLFSGWQPDTYLALIVSWGLLPVLVQLAFGADILLANLRAVVLAILTPTLYLWLVDALAISSGTWTIDPIQTTGLKIGPLPLEEMVFFMMTNILITFGMRLMMSETSQQRIKSFLHFALGRKTPPTQPGASRMNLVDKA